jgi:hypothetical protein
VTPGKPTELIIAVTALQTGEFITKGHGMRVSAYGYSAFFAFFVCASCSVMALPLTVFRSESQAQRHCPGDTIVWLDFKAGRYYQKGQKRYASGFTGSFVCRSEARASSYRRSLLGLR